MDLREIALIEELAANAVPPAITQELDGWRLRFNWGVTRRANSVLAAHTGGALGPDERIALAEQFYTRRGSSTRFQLCPASQPTDLEDLLVARGYQADGPPTNVQTAPITALQTVHAAGVEVDEQPSEAWHRAYCESEGVTDPVKIIARREMLRHSGPPTGFAAIERDGQIAAVALGVVERGWLGIFSVATHPHQRRRGLGSAVLAGLAAWAGGYGAERAYLQVFSINAPALAMYARMGFRTLYQYHYREKAI